jgi:hypothetical protein
MTIGNLSPAAHTINTIHSVFLVAFLPIAVQIHNVPLKQTTVQW